MADTLIFKSVQDAIAETFGVEPNEIDGSSTADDVDGWDSLAHATLVFRLERIFNIDLPQAEASAAQNVGELVALVARTQQQGLSRSLPDSVFVGTDNSTLFHRDHQVVEQLTGHQPLRPHELRQWSVAIETRHAWCAARGIPYVHMIVPEKHVIYEDLVPDGMKPAQHRPVTQLLASVTRPARGDVLYPQTRLRKARHRREVYLANDTHWNMFGGFIGYHELMSAANRHLPLSILEEDDVLFSDRSYVGDLGARVSPEQATMAPIASHRNPSAFRIIYENKRFSRGNLTVYEGPDRSLPRAIMFRDSFAIYMIPHMIPMFSRLTTVSSVSMLYDLVEAERPDIVFFQMIERFLNFDRGPDMPKDLPSDLSETDATELLGISPASLAKME